jgi:Cu(I)/Ag(I) efflux system periplasmic protein CusF
MKLRELVTLTVLSLTTIAAYASNDHAKGHSQQPATSAAPSSELPMADAEVRKVDTKAAKVTLRHDRLENLDMAPMTMVFGVKDPAWLTSMKPGDKIRIAVDRVNGALTVVKMEPAK